MKKVLALILVVLIGIMSGGGCGSNETTDIPATVIAGAGVGGDVPAAASVPVSGSLASLLIIKNAITGAELFRTTSSPWIAYIDPALTIKIEVYNDNDLTTPRSSIKVEMPAVTTSTTNPTNTIVCDFDELGKDSIAVVPLNTSGAESEAAVKGESIEAATFIKLPTDGSEVTLNSTTEIPSGTSTVEVNISFEESIPTKAEVTTIKATTEPVGFTVTMPNTTTGVVTFQFATPVTLGAVDKPFQFYAKMTKDGTTKEAKGYAQLYLLNSAVRIKTSTDGENWTLKTDPLTSVTMSPESSGKISSITLTLTADQPSSIFAPGTDFSENTLGNKVTPGTYYVTLEFVNKNSGLTSSYGPTKITVN